MVTACCDNSWCRGRNVQESHSDQNPSLDRIVIVHIIYSTHVYIVGERPRVTFRSESFAELNRTASCGLYLMVAATLLDASLVTSLLWFKVIRIQSWSWQAETVLVVNVLLLYLRMPKPEKLELPSEHVL